MLSFDVCHYAVTYKSKQSWVVNIKPPLFPGIHYSVAPFTTLTSLLGKLYLSFDLEVLSWCSFCVITTTLQKLYNKAVGVGRRNNDNNNQETANVSRKRAKNWVTRHVSEYTYFLKQSNFGAPTQQSV